MNSRKELLTQDTEVEEIRLLDSDFIEQAKRAGNVRELSGLQLTDAMLDGRQVLARVIEVPGEPSGLSRSYKRSQTHTGQSAESRRSAGTESREQPESKHRLRATVTALTVAYVGYFAITGFDNSPVQMAHDVARPAEFAYHIADKLGFVG